MSFFVYYGHDPDCLEFLARYQTVVIEAAGFAEDFLARLNQRVPRLLGYLSLAQYPGWKGKPPPEYAAERPDTTWGSWWVDPANPAWRRDCVARARQLNSTGLGLFLDNLDVTPDWGAAMVRLVAEVRNAAPNSYLLGNRGFSLLRELTPYLDGVLFENPCDAAFTDSDRAWVWERALELEAGPLDIFALDYADRYSPQSSSEFRRRFGDWPYLLAANQSLQNLV